MVTVSLTYGDIISLITKIVAPCLPKSGDCGIPFFPTTREIVLQVIVQKLVVLYNIVLQSSKL